MDDAGLIRRCQRGEEAAFEALFGRYSRQVARTAYLITGDRRVAEEVMQETFIQVFRAIGQLREAEAFPGWLHRTAVREAQRQSRQESEHRRAPELLEVATAPPQDGLATRELLWQAMAHLPVQQRAAVVLYYYHDQPVAEVARQMQAPEGTVKSWLHRAKAALARCLREEGTYGAVD